MIEDKITVLRNEFCAVLERLDETALSDESIVRSALELENKLEEYKSYNC